MEKSVQLSNFAIIDVSLFQDKRLSSTDCCVYGLISSLSNLVIESYMSTTISPSQSVATDIAPMRKSVRNTQTLK